MEDLVLPDFDFIDDEIKGDETTNEKKEDILGKPSASEFQNQFSDEEPDDEPDFQEEDEEPKQTTKRSEPADGEASGLYQFYRDKGFIANEYEDFDGSYDQLAQILEHENATKLQQSQEAILQAIVNSPNPVTSKVLEYVVTKGNDLTPDEFRKIIDRAEAANVDLTEESFNDESVAEDYLTKQLMEQGDDEETIEEIIELYKDKGTLKKKALAAFKKDLSLKTKDLEKEVNKVKEERAQAERNIEEFQKGFVEAINETGWMDKRKQIVYNELAQGGFKNKIESIYNHPRGLVQLLDFMSYFNPEDGTFNLDNYKKSSVSDGVKETKENLMNYFRGTGNLSGSDKGFGTKVKSLNDIEFAD
jgi:hypothetical protein